VKIRPIAAAAALLLTVATPAGAAEGVLRPALLWSLNPGGGFFYLDEPGSGVAYAATTAAFLGAGAEVERRNRKLGRDDEVNVPALVGEKVWEYSVFSTFRTALARDGVDLRAERFDDTPTPLLLTAPFRPGVAMTWPVAGAALFGVAAAALTAQHPAGRLSDVERARMLGSDFNRNDATALYTASAAGISLGAATAEEGLFRGILQTILQERYGDTAGLWGAAGTFGAAHILAPDGSVNPAGVVFGTGAGLYLGWLYNRDDHRLAGPIAAHFWYDFTLLATCWALEPDDTPLGFDVQFRF